MKEFDVSALSLKHCHWTNDASGTRWTYFDDVAITKAARESCSLLPAAAAARVNELEQQIAALKQFVDARAGLLVPLPTVDAQA